MGVMATSPNTAQAVMAGTEAVQSLEVQSLLAHQVELALDRGDTAWLIVATAFVLFMTLPGLALFYAGMVRKKNLLSTMANVAAAGVISTLIWIWVGYSLAFSVNPLAGLNPFVGGLDTLFLSGVGLNTAFAPAPQLPEFLWVAFQMTFAIITPAIIAGSVAERMKFSAFCLFVALWVLLVYAPVCHWVWGGGFLGGWGVLDFAGGAVVHVNSGVAGLVAALILGKRRGFRRDNMAPHNLTYTLIGTSILFVGWIGFNAGSALEANGLAAVALLNTVVAAMAGAVGWGVPEWIERKRPTLLGMLSGIVAGLVAITPAAGFVNPGGALALGLITGPVCYIACTYVKNTLKYDDSLDAFGIHGVGGFVGAVLTAFFADASINAAGAEADAFKQFAGTAAVMAWSAALTFVILMICKFTTGLRVSDEDEIEGLDTSQHGETLHG